MSAPRPSADSRGRAFWIAFVVGWGLMAFGVAGAIADRRRADPAALARYVLEFALLHDALVAPLVFLVGWLASEALPLVARGPVRGALALSALLAVFAIPLVRRFGAHPTNSSALPLDYTHSLVVVLGAVWGVTLAVLVSRSVRAGWSGRRRADRGR